MRIRIQLEPRRNGNKLAVKPWEVTISRQSERPFDYLIVRIANAETGEEIRFEAAPDGK